MCQRVHRTRPSHGAQERPCRDRRRRVPAATVRSRPGRGSRAGFARLLVGQTTGRCRGTFRYGHDEGTGAAIGTETCASRPRTRRASRTASAFACPGGRGGRSGRPAPPTPAKAGPLGRGAARTGTTTACRRRCASTPGPASATGGRAPPSPRRRWPWPGRATRAPARATRWSPPRAGRSPGASCTWRARAPSRRPAPPRSASPACAGPSPTTPRCASHPLRHVGEGAPGGPRVRAPWPNRTGRRSAYRRVTVMLCVEPSGSVSVIVRGPAWSPLVRRRNMYLPAR